MSMAFGSFSFGGINSVTKYGIYCTNYYPFIPPKRPRKIVIPGRHGTHDYGSTSYDEIGIRVDCSCFTELSRADLREVTGWLSKKGRMIFWDEDEKFYVGELFSGPSINWRNIYSMEPFSLSFTCEPFAYKEKPTKVIARGGNVIGYEGTEKAPFVLTVSNPNLFPVSNLEISILKRDGDV
jgi:phage-related protein